MNSTQPYMDMHSAPHMSSAQSYASQPATSGGVSHYSQYPQPPVLQPGSAHYAPAPNSFGTYGYANGVTSPQSASHPGSGPVGTQVPSHGLTLPAMMTGPPTQSHQYMGAGGAPAAPYPSQHTFDTTGQIAPPGMKPRVTATLWEDEGSLCFQVEAKGVCVARREDNHMINGTKLLNVAGMTRGRRDGILKSEKTRHVVKIGPMHLKGVWIPYERALDFANKEKITELLYPLFVHNIGGLLYNPENAPRTSAVLAATEQRRLNGAPAQGQRTTQVSQPPALHHHHSMQGAIGSHVSSTPHSIAPHPGAGRPGLDRAHTFPTPPTSASSVMGMGNQGSSYEWGGQNLASNVTGSQPLSIDTGLSNARSMPTTPATTPPGGSIQHMPPYPGQQSYDTPKQFYSAPPSSQTIYTQQRYSQPMAANGYKNDMGPPSAPGPAPEVDQHDIKPDPYGHSTGNGPVGHTTADGEADHHHDHGYMSSNASAYNSNRTQYAYNPSSSISGDHPHLSPELAGSPSHQTGSGRGTPRTATGTQPQWAQGYQTPPRPAPSGNLYNAVSDSRTPNPTTSGDNYSTPTYPNSSLNGIGTSVKRSREEDEDQGGRPSSRGMDPSYDLKRRKTIRQDTLGAPMGSMPNMQGIKTGGGLPRQR